MFEAEIWSEKWNDKYSIGWFSSDVLEADINSSQAVNKALTELTNPVAIIMLQNLENFLSIKWLSENERSFIRNNIQVYDDFISVNWVELYLEDEVELWTHEKLWSQVPSRSQWITLLSILSPWLNRIKLFREVLWFDISFSWWYLLQEYTTESEETLYERRVRSYLAREVAKEDNQKMERNKQKHSPYISFRHLCAWQWEGSEEYLLSLPPGEIDKFSAFSELPHSNYPAKVRKCRNPD